MSMNHLLAITTITNADPKAPLVLRGDLGMCIRQAKELGYGAVEIHVIDAPSFPMDAVRAALAETGMRISSIVTGRIFTQRGLCITSTDPANRDAAMKELRDYIDIAASLSAVDGVIIGWVKGNRRTDDPDFDRLLADQLRELGLYAGQRGQKLLIEVINRYETNLFNTAGELRDFIETWQLPNCRIHLDTFHMNIDEANLPAAIETAGDLLGYFHVADSNRLAPGRGHMDFAAMFSALHQINYGGTISLECIPWPDSLTAGADSYTYLTNVLKKY
ncbi:MAG: TIM barrel protein [Faecousia sp.]